MKTDLFALMALMQSLPLLSLRIILCCHLAVDHSFEQLTKLGMDCFSEGPSFHLNFGFVLAVLCYTPMSSKNSD